MTGLAALLLLPSCALVSDVAADQTVPQVRLEAPELPAEGKPFEGAGSPDVPEAVAREPLSGSQRPRVSLDRLFELPAGFEAKPAEQRAGGGENEWRRRFSEARETLERNSVDLQRSKAELANLAEESNAWTLAPPIGGASTAATDAPLSFELRQRMKRQEAAISQAKKDLVNLEIAANLADVPESWRR